MLLQQLARGCCQFKSLAASAGLGSAVRHLTAHTYPGELSGGIHLTEEQLGMQALAHDFAREQMLPHAAKWDEQKIFPVDVMKEAAKLGFAGRSGWLCSDTGTLCHCSTVQQYRPATAAAFYCTP
jgi:alkylation response protein AidB-like acyl-CoA dehydrogenase